MLVICTVKIVSFLVIFNPVNFPFFFFLPGSHGPFTVQFMLSGTSVPCWHEFLVQFRLCDFLQCCFAKLHCRDTLLTPSSVQSSFNLPLQKGKVWKDWGSHHLPDYFLFQEPFSGCCLSHQLLQGGNRPRALGAGGRSLVLLCTA